MPKPQKIEQQTGSMTYIATAKGFVVFNKDRVAVHSDYTQHGTDPRTHSQRADAWLETHEDCMTPAEYAKAAATFAAYPPNQSTYAFLGLSGECGELMEITRPDRIKANDRAAVMKELGDLCWYVAECCRCIGIQFDQVFNFETVRVISVEDAHLELPIIVGRICELAKKCIRDDGGKWGGHRHQAAKAAVESLSAVICSYARKYGLSMTDVFAANIGKLTSRRDRNVIKGDGNDR